ncbi:MAG: PilZ domain-containing protein [Candidatus Acidiferrum sp.]
MSTTAQQLPAIPTTIERRFYSRIIPPAPIYIAIDGKNEGLLINVSENGLLLSAPAELRCNFVARITIPLSGLPKPIQVCVRVVWASEASKLVGIQLLDLNEHDREQIRKWGARESTPSLQRENNRHWVVAKTSTATSAFAGKAHPQSPPAVAPYAFPGVVRTRSTSAVAGKMKWPLLMAVVCLASVSLLRYGALGNPFARSTESREGSGGVTPPDQNVQRSLPNPDTAAHDAINDIAPPLSGDTAKPGTLARKRDLGNSAQVEDNQTDDRDSGGFAVETRQNRRSSSQVSAPPPSRALGESNPAQENTQVESGDRGSAQNNQSVTGATTDAAPESNSTSTRSSAREGAPPERPTAFARQPTETETFRIPMPSNGAAGSSVATPSKRNFGSASPLVPLKSDPLVIQMDAPGRRVMEIHLPRGYRESFFNLPGERILESSSATMHIQRSVRIPTTHAGWPFHRDKKVVVGDLISRIDPQVSSSQLGPTDFVHVRAIVAEDGRVASVRSIHGTQNLMPAVVKAVYRWHYQPTLVDGKPVETRCEIVVQFHVPVGPGPRP